MSSCVLTIGPLHWQIPKKLSGPTIAHLISIRLRGLVNILTECLKMASSDDKRATGWVSEHVSTVFGVWRRAKGLFALWHRLPWVWELQLWANKWFHIASPSHKRCHWLNQTSIQRWLTWKNHWNEQPSGCFTTSHAFKFRNITIFLRSKTLTPQKSSFHWRNGDLDKRTKLALEIWTLDNSWKTWTQFHNTVYHQKRNMLPISIQVASVGLQPQRKREEKSPSPASETSDVTVANVGAHSLARLFWLGRLLAWCLAVCKFPHQSHKALSPENTLFKGF